MDTFKTILKILRQRNVEDFASKKSLKVRSVMASKCHNGHDAKKDA